MSAVDQSALLKNSCRSEMGWGLSQPEMLRRLGFEDQIDYTTISKYELDKNEPPLDISLQYARVAGVHMEDIVYDELDLPARLPGNIKLVG